MSRRLLFVDDEENVVKCLRRLFIRSEYEVETALSAAEALDIMAHTPVDMIVADQRMPYMDGYTLLGEVRKKYPDVIRIMLSGYTEKHTSLKVVLDGTAKAYITKPWDNDRLRQDIAGIFYTHEQTHNKGTLAVIESIETLPVLPESYHRILARIEEGADMDAIAADMEKEQGYAARVLSVVNSAFYGVSIGSVKQALVYLGLDTVKNIVLSFEIYTHLGALRRTDYSAQLWTHANLTNTLLHGLYPRVYGQKIPEQFAAVGLLHDIGHLVVLAYFPIQYTYICKRLHMDTNPSLTRIEQELLGTTHTRIGGYLLDWWNLPAAIVGACLQHHGPFDAQVYHPEIAALTHCASIYSRRYLEKDTPLQLDPDALAITGEDEEQMTGMVEAILNENHRMRPDKTTDKSRSADRD